MTARYFPAAAAVRTACFNATTANSSAQCAPQGSFSGARSSRFVTNAPRANFSMPASRGSAWPAALGSSKTTMGRAPVSLAHGASTKSSPDSRGASWRTARNSCRNTSLAPVAAIATRERTAPGPRAVPTARPGGSANRPVLSHALDAPPASSRQTEDFISVLTGWANPTNRG